MAVSRDRGRPRLSSAGTHAASRAWEAAQLAWPGVRLAQGAFVEHLTATLDPVGGAEQDLGEVDTDGLYLAAACLRQDPTALECLKELLTRAVRSVRRFNASSAFAEDVQQALLLKLLTASSGRRPRLEGYSGKGSLLAWMRAAAIRTAINSVPVAPEGPADPSDFQVMRGEPEMEMIHAQNSQVLKQSLHAALEQLTDKEIGILRLFFVEQLTVEQIGQLYKVNKSSVSRWLAEIRRRVLRQTRKTLAGLVGESAVDSVVRQQDGAFITSLSSLLKR